MRMLLITKIWAHVPTLPREVCSRALLQAPHVPPYFLPPLSWLFSSLSRLHLLPSSHKLHPASCMQENGSAWSAPRRVFFADVGPHAGSREAFRHGNSDAGDVFVIVESKLESAAVPLPAKYQMVTDVYGSNAARDAILLA
ncbi:hypothetical protein VaNZ11_010270 [Volvox africanus]|uniref:Uncharacterized protein n=1 Tax=Volvox africanus TaxID=51714 RepID=A0ABQ5SAS2_9CHLO|nr:hypothetical protein VaNZ11_010270 [Volvox africanus]